MGIFYIPGFCFSGGNWGSISGDIPTTPSLPDTLSALAASPMTEQCVPDRMVVFPKLISEQDRQSRESPWCVWCSVWQTVGSLECFSCFLVTTGTLHWPGFMSTVSYWGFSLAQRAQHLLRKTPSSFTMVV